MSREVRKKIHKNKFIVTIERTLRNSSTEHLEMDIHCRHRRLFPNNSFVRDLVSILNDKDIRVINNGRVFEKNKVTDLDKDHLRQLEDKAQRTTEPPEREGEESKDASAEMTRAPPAATPRDEEVAPPRLTTEDPKPKKRHHKKKHSSPRAEKRPRGREPSLLLSDRDSYHVAIGSGANGTVAQLPTAGAASQRARETDDEWERGSEFFKTRSSMEHGGPANERDFVSSLRPYGSSELRVSEDRARGAERGGGDRTQGYKGGADRTRGDYREEVDGTNALRGDARNAVDSARDTRPLDRPRGGLADEDRSERARVREAIARHAEMYRGAEAGGRRGQAGPQVLSEAQGRPYEDRDAAANQPWVSHATDKDKTRYALDRDSSGRNTVHRDGSDRNTEDRDTSGRQTPVKAHHTDTIDARNFHPADFDEKRAWPRLISTDVDNPNSWDPWGPREPGAAERADTRKAAKGPHDAVAQLVYHDVWDRGAAPVRGHDRRVAELAKEVMMEYDDVTEKPPPAALPQPRAASRETGVAERESRGRALRVRLKSNMTFNLGDELLNWRRMKMTGQDSESGSPSDEADSHVEAD